MRCILPFVPIPNIFTLMMNDKKEATNGPLRTSHKNTSRSA